MASIHRSLWSCLFLLALFSSLAWAQLPDSADTYIVSGSSTIQGSNPSMAIQGPTAGALIKPDISQLTGAGVAAGQVTKAYLKVYKTAVAVGGTVDVCEINSAWTESVTYASKPGFGGPHQTIQAGLSIPTGSASQYLQIDITTAVQDWLNGTANNGIAIVPSTGTPCAGWPTAGNSVSMTIDSKESTTSSHAPEVDVVLSTSFGQLQGTVPVNALSGTYNINVTGYADTLYATTQCGGGYYSTGISTSGTAQCANNGSALTSLNPANISAGSAAISITGNANSATTANTAAFATAAGSTTSFTGSLLGDVTGTQGATVVSKIGGVDRTKFARLDLANVFTGGKQVLAASASGYASLNIPANGAAPTSPVNGDIWTINTDRHLQFQTMTGLETLAFTSDITTANNAQTTALNNEIARATGAESTLTLSLAGEVTRATGAEMTLTTNLGNEVTRATGAEAALNSSKANIAGGNIFTGGSQVLAASSTSYPSLNVPDTGAAPSTPHSGDIWLLNTDPHLNFRDMNGITQMLAFTSDITTANNAQTTALNNEITRATGAENTLTTSLAGEVTRATGAEMTLTTNLSNEVTRATGAEAALNTSKANLAGGNTFTGTQALGPLSNAASQPSNLFRLNANDGSSVSQSAQLQALADGSLSFQFGPTAGPISPKLNIDKNGLITFAAGQAFPGAQTLTAGTGISIVSNAINNTGVTSLTGTANQINASASTGGVTLSLPASINVNAATATVAGTITGSIGGGQVTGNITGNAGNVTGTVAVANGGTGVSSANANSVFAGPSTGAATAPAFRSLVAADLPAPQNTRTICYVAGADNNSSALDTSFSQKSYFNNLIGAMTVTSATCQVDAGSVTMAVQKNNTATAITASVLCNTGPGSWQALSISTSSLALNDSLDLNITAASTAKRLTVCVAGTVN